MSDLRSMAGLVTLREMPVGGMITVRGDLGSPAMQGALTLPDRGTCVEAGGEAVAWMSPDELLVLCPHDAVAHRVSALREALAGTHHLVENVSDARVHMKLEGAQLREVLAKVCPVDLRPSASPVGKFRRTRVAQVPCAFWLRAEDEADLIAFRSVADYVWGVLAHAADAAAPVGHF